jgi:phage-related baseplate assembly protein
VSDFSTVQNYSDINFVDTSVENLLSAAITAYQDTYYGNTGESVVVEPGSDVYILLYAQALREYSILQSINNAARQNFLKYAAGDYLDNLAANTGCTRSAATAAVTTMRFTLGKAQTVTITIPQGTRVTPGNSIYFATDKEVSIAAGDTSVTVTATCTAIGTAGNGYIAGQISTLVDSVAYVSTVTNTEKSQGGTDEETDTELAEKVFLSPEGFSVAGPSGAYEYFAKAYSSSIIDTYVYSPSAGAVNMRVLLTGGELPGTAFLTELAEYIGDDSRRPLTDNFTASAPDTVSYDINLTYYINSADAGNASTIQAAVTSAVSNYVLWQKSKIGRDITPDKLTALIIAAGAKRVVITAPVYTAVADTAVAIASSTQTVTYGGTE